MLATRIQLHDGIGNLAERLGAATSNSCVRVIRGRPRIRLDDFLIRVAATAKVLELGRQGR